MNTTSVATSTNTIPGRAQTNRARPSAMKSSVRAIVQKIHAAAPVRRGRKPGKPHQAGPRGFNFGPVWLLSVKRGKGVALKPRNLPKLLAMAEAYKVHVSANLTQVDIASKVARAL